MNKNQNGQNNYIYNKYFNEKVDIQPKILKPKTIKEWREMVIKQAVDEHNRRRHVNIVKSKKLIMPGNIHMSNQSKPELNNLFKFVSNR